MPPFLLPEVAKLFGFMLNDLSFLRFPTIRHNISYSVRVEQHNTIASVADFFTQQFHTIEDVNIKTDTAILYCTNVDICIGVARHLGAHAYHGRLTDYNARRTILDNWCSGVGSSGMQHPYLIIATSALGAGVDIPGVRLVVHWNSPSSIIDFAQQSGRAGRDGR